MKPFFSVVIPTYNRAGELKRAIESVLAQSFTDFEILVMDDGSTDNTASIVSSFNDLRITYEWDKNFGGPARPRNRGVAKAQGEWVCFLDADDWWKSNKLEACFKNINDQVDLLYHDLEIVRDPPSFFKRKKLKSRQLKKPVLVDLLVNGNTVANSSVVVRKKLLDEVGGIDENKKMIATEDFNVWLRIAKITDAFFYIPNSLGYYMLHKHGISRKDMSISYQCAVANFIGQLSDAQREAVKGFLAYMSGRYHFINGEYDKATDKLKYCFKASANFRIRLRVVYMLISIVFFRIVRHKI